MENGFTKDFTTRIGVVIGMAALFAASPVTLTVRDGLGLPGVAIPAAEAKSGNSGSGSGSSGRGGSDDSGRGGSDDSGHHSGTDDSGHHGGVTGGVVGGDGAIKIERSASGIEVTYADGTREEIENGRYERKNSAGRTVEERPATQADIDRLSAL